MRELEIKGEGRLDVVVSKGTGISRSHAQKLIKEGFVEVEGRREKPSKILKGNERVRVLIPPPRKIELEPEDIPLSVLYEDSDLLVIEKPAGIPVHPGPGHPSRTIVNAILKICPDMEIKGTIRPGIVHRLDKDTSGIMLVAKNDKALEFLQAQFKEREVVKKYLVLVKGRVYPPEGEINAPIGRHPRNRKKMAIVFRGREAITLYKVIKYLPEHTYLEAEPKTGRTHQIRVHFSSLAHPILGDEIYGGRSKVLNRLFLHAHYIKFKTPKVEVKEFSSPLPPELEEVLKILEKGRNKL